LKNDIIGRIERATGHSHAIIYDLLFTADRMIALIIEHPADVPYQSNLMDFFMGSRSRNREEQIERGKIAEGRRLMYAQEATDRLVATHDRNFEVPLDAIVSMEIKTGLFNPRLKVTVCRPDSREVALSFGLPRNAVSLARELVEKVLTIKATQER